MSKLHYSQMNAFDRARRREERRDTAGTPTRDGSVSYFHQFANNAPTDEDTRSSVQWNNGVEHNGPVTHQCGARFDKLFLDE